HFFKPSRRTTILSSFGVTGNATSHRSHCWLRRHRPHYASSSAFVTIPLFLLTYSFPKTVETVSVEATTFFFCFPPLKPPTTNPSPQFCFASSFDLNSIEEE
ncbi:hypothetical protein V8G54_006811, partial [Vigna mungo]